jgi:hypothetical protein
MIPYLIPSSTLIQYVKRDSIWIGNRMNRQTISGKIDSQKRILDLELFQRGRQVIFFITNLNTEYI